MKEAKSWLEKTQNFKNHRRVIKKKRFFFFTDSAGLCRRICIFIIQNRNFRISFLDSNAKFLKFFSAFFFFFSVT